MINFLYCSAYKHIIFCWVMDRQSIIDSIVERLDVKGCVVTCISLMADARSLRERLSADVLKGIRTADVIERSVVRIPLYQELDTIKIDTKRENGQGDRG